MTAQPAQPLDPGAKPEGLASPSPAEALSDVVDLVAKDARRAPADYLAETIVPEGGE